MIRPTNQQIAERIAARYPMAEGRGDFRAWRQCSLCSTSFYFQTEADARAYLLEQAKRVGAIGYGGPTNNKLDPVESFIQCRDGRVILITDVLAEAMSEDERRAVFMAALASLYGAPEAAPTFGVVVRLIGEAHEGENWEAGIATQAEAERKAASGYTGAGSEARAVRFDSSEPWAQGAPVGAWHTFAPSVLSPSLERASLQGLAAWQWLAVFKAAGFTRKGGLNFAPLWRDVLDGRATLEQIADCVPGFSPHYVQAKFGRYVARARDRRRAAPEGAMRWLVILRWRGVVVGEMRATRVVSLETARAHMDQFAGATFAAWREYSFAPARRNLERLEAGEPLYFSYADETGAASVVIKLADQ